MCLICVYIYTRFDLFNWKNDQSNVPICRYVAAELATDIIVNVGDVKFYLHKV